MTHFKTVREIAIRDGFQAFIQGKDLASTLRHKLVNDCDQISESEQEDYSEAFTNAYNAGILAGSKF